MVSAGPPAKLEFSSLARSRFWEQVTRLRPLRQQNRILVPFWSTIMRSQPVLDEAFFVAFESNVRRYGYTAVIRALEMRHFQLGAPTGGRPPIDDTERLKRMEYHLLNDPDLAERNRDGDERLLSQAARRAICDLPRDGEVLIGVAGTASVPRSKRQPEASLRGRAPSRLAGRRATRANGWR